MAEMRNVRRNPATGQAIGRVRARQSFVRIAEMRERLNCLIGRRVSDETMPVRWLDLVAPPSADRASIAWRLKATRPAFASTSAAAPEAPQQIPDRFQKGRVLRLLRLRLGRLVALELWLGVCRPERKGVSS